MSELQNTANDTEKRHGLTVIEGGKTKRGGKEPPTGNWVAQLEVGTVFLVRQRIEINPFCSEYHVVGQGDGVTRLIDPSFKGRKKWVWVDSIRFSEFFELVQILGSYKI